MTTAIAGEDVYAIAQDVFSAMIDGETDTLFPWDGEVPAWGTPLVAWVDLSGDWAGRAALTTEAETAHDLARALLGLPAGSPVSDEDLVDAFGEIVNVVGGNIKSLLPTTGKLSLPRVADSDPGLPGSEEVAELRLAWKGRPLTLTVHGVP